MINCQKEGGFSFVEVLIGVGISSILLSFVFMTFFRTNDNFERAGKVSALQKRARQTMQALRTRIDKGGVDPCRRYFWDSGFDDDSASPPIDMAGYYYAPVHPFRTGLMLSGLPINVNPNQAFIIHEDTTSTPNAEGLSTCVSDGTQTDNLLVTGSVHNVPSNSSLIFVNDLKNFGNTSTAFLAAPAPFEEKDLISVPVIYPATVSGNVALDWTNAKILSKNVECMFVEYFIPSDQSGGCAGSGTVPEGNICKINPEFMTGFIDGNIRGVNQVQISLTLASNSPQRGYEHPAEYPKCAPLGAGTPGGAEVILPTGVDYGSQPYPYQTFTIQNRMELSSIRYRD